MPKRRLTSAALPIRSIPTRSNTKIRSNFSAATQAAFRQSWTGRRRLQCRSCRCCELARRARQFAGPRPGLRSDHHATSGRRLDRRRRGGNDNRQRNILGSYPVYKRQSPCAAQNLAPLPPQRSLRLGASKLAGSFSKGGGAGRFHTRSEQLFRYYWQDRTHGHRRSRAQPAASLHTIRYARLRPRARQLTQFVKRSSAQSCRKTGRASPRIEGSTALASRCLNMLSITREAVFRHPPDDSLGEGEVAAF